MILAGWYVYMVAESRQAAVVEDLRFAGLEVVRLMCFQEVSRRAHRSVKRRRVTERRVVPALGEYVFIRLGSAVDVLAVRALGAGCKPMKMGPRLAPRLSAAGEAWVKDPPRQMFPDTETPPGGGETAPMPEEMAVGDRVGVVACNFDGYKGEIVRVDRDRVTVHFSQSMFDYDVPLSAVVKL